MDILFSVLPIVILIYLMTKKNSVPSYKALPFVALLLYAIKLIYFESDPNQINAAVIDGLLTAWTPLLIVWGAILLFKTMEHSGGMDVIRAWLNSISDNKVAQLMIVAWAFGFMIEGASGFGTPAMLAAPILVGMGFPLVRVAIVTLIMNSVPVSFGAVGTPTWFGLGQLGLTHEQILEIGFKTTIIHSAAALFIPPIALLFVVSRQEVKRNLLFIYLSIFSCIVPYVILGKFTYEFPSLLGGMVGLFLTVFLAHKGVGLAPAGPEEARAPSHAPAPARLAKALFPLWGVIIILGLTRIPQLGLKGFLRSATPAWDVHLGSLADLSFSASGVVSLKNIFGTASNWKHELLYVPSLIPFFLVSFIAFVVFKMGKAVRKQVLSETYAQMKRPIQALLGALVFVELLKIGGDQASTKIIGNSFADLVRASGTSWQYFASYLGALGAFFAGSNTVSNLTFGGVQESIALSLELNRMTILSLQSVGGAMGNMVCINNIVAVCAVIGLTDKEGYIMKRNVIPMILYGIIAAIVSVFI